MLVERMWTCGERELRVQARSACNMVNFGRNSKVLQTELEYFVAPYQSRGIHGNDDASPGMTSWLEESAQVRCILFSPCTDL